MRTVDRKMLFVSHDASRTGAPIILRDHLRYWHSTGMANAMDIYLMRDGELASEFKRFGSRVAVNTTPWIYRLLFRIWGNEKYLHYGFYRWFKSKRYEMVYGNTVVSLPLLKVAKGINPSVTTFLHVHELNYGIKQFLGQEVFTHSIKYVDHFIAASRLVKEMLHEEFLIPLKQIYLYYEHILLPEIDETDPLPALKQGFIIIGCGTPDWRKGIDVFIQIAAWLKRYPVNKPFHFYWIGGRKYSQEYERAQHDIEKLDVQDCVTLIESVEKPYEYMKSGDVFLLTSREDPFPVVCLEAAAMGKPIICFDHAGGIIDFVDESNGWVIGYLNIEQAAKLIMELIDEPRLAKEKGIISSLKVSEYDINYGGTALWDFLTNAMKDQSHIP